MVRPKSLALQDPLRSLKENLAFHIEEYHHHFQTATSANHELGEAYIRGLFKAEASWRNMERMNEELDVSGDGYQRLQQFISDSPWSASALISDLAVKTSEFYASQPTYQRRDVGYILDESAHLKKGKQSVGVARQYAGVIGKVENCQVGVYASLVWNTHIWSAPRCKRKIADQQKETLRPYIRRRDEVALSPLAP